MPPKELCRKYNMTFDSNKLNEISVFDVAERLGIIIKRGKAKCFLHDEKTPSLSFNKKKNFWYCFGCGQGGGTIDLVTKKTGLVFSDACQWLINEFNISSVKKTYGKIKIPTSKASKLSNEKLESIYHPDSVVYKWIIDHSSLSNSAKEFLFSQRKFPEELITKLQIKSTDDTKLLYQQCLLTFGVDRLIKCGIVKENTNSRGDIFLGFKWWQPTILIPYFNVSGAIISIQGRNLDPSSEYRYINLNGIETCIYNLQIVNELSKGQELIICEGVTDCIASLSMGRPAIGIPGASAFKEEYVELLKSYKLILVPDRDETGPILEKKIKNLFLKNGKEVFVSKLDKNFKDLSDYYIHKFCKS
jgi:DNA primase